MTQFFLKAKHWQLFLLTFGVLIVYQIAVLFIVFSNMDPTGEPDPGSLLTPFKIYPVVILIYLAVFFGWMWTVTNKLQEKITDELRQNLTWFNRLIYIPIILTTLLAAYVIYIINEMFYGDNLPEFSLVGSLVAIQLITVICSFYCMYITAKNIKLVEKQSPVTFGDFIGEFVLIWLFPIGVWFLQPRVNEITEDEIV